MENKKSNGIGWFGLLVIILSSLMYILSSCSGPVINPIEASEESKDNCSHIDYTERDDVFLIFQKLTVAIASVSEDSFDFALNMEPIIYDGMIDYYHDAEGKTSEQKAESILKRLFSESPRSFNSAKKLLNFTPKNRLIDVGTNHITILEKETGFQFVIQWDSNPLNYYEYSIVYDDEGEEEY